MKHFSVGHHTKAKKYSGSQPHCQGAKNGEVMASPAAPLPTPLPQHAVSCPGLASSLILAREYYRVVYGTVVGPATHVYGLGMHGLDMDRLIFLVMRGEGGRESIRSSSYE